MKIHSSVKIAAKIPAKPSAPARISTIYGWARGKTFAPPPLESPFHCEFNSVIDFVLTRWNELANNSRNAFFNYCNAIKTEPPPEFGPYQERPDGPGDCRYCKAVWHMNFFAAEFSKEEKQ